MDYFSCICLCLGIIFVDGNGQLKTKQLTKEIATVVLSSFWKLLKCFFYDEGSRIGGIFKKTGETGQVRRDCY